MTQQHHRDWQAVMEKIAHLGSVGGFCGPMGPRSSAFMTIRDCSSVDPSELRCEFEVQQLLPYAAVALANALASFSAKVLPLQHATIFAPVDLTPSTESDVIRLTSDLPFPLSDERVIFASGFDIEVRLRKPHPEEVLLKIEDAYGHWFSAVNLGCFASETYSPDRCFVYPGEETKFGPDSVLLSIEKAMFSEPEGLDSLTSVFQWVHEQVAEIASVDLYE